MPAITLCMGWAYIVVELQISNLEKGKETTVLILAMPCAWRDLAIDKKSELEMLFIEKAKKVRKLLIIL